MCDYGSKSIVHELTIIRKLQVPWENVTTSEAWSPNMDFTPQIHLIAYSSSFLTLCNMNIESNGFPISKTDSFSQLFEEIGLQYKKKRPMVVNSSTKCLIYSLCLWGVSYSPKMEAYEKMYRIKHYIRSHYMR